MHPLTTLITALLVIQTFSCPLKPTHVDCQTCHSMDPAKINVHVIAHSHDDVGWLKTVDEYFWGKKNNVQRACVKDIISTVVEALKANPERRFIQVETAFFWKWWQVSSEAERADFVSLVNNGQLEMVNAAWSMNDEAATHYHSIIDQFTLGLRTVNETVGKCGAPRIGWQIDPFGHSREQASLFAQFGFGAVFFARIDYEDKQQRIANKNMEVIWRGSASLEDSTNIFTNMFPDFYFSPNGFCFDIECGDRIGDYNLASKVARFGNYAKEYAQYYKTKNVLIPMGGDFHFRSASTNFDNIDKLLKGFKDDPMLNVVYSTPSCYLDAVHNEARSRDVEFTLKTDDFFPYGSDKNNYWTGYFTSRPNAKRFERYSHNLLQSAKQLASFASVSGMDWNEDLVPLKQALGIMQHHDAITGTAKQVVADDYVRLMTDGTTRVENLIGSTIEQLLVRTGGNLPLNLKNCMLTNVSICEGSGHEKFVVSVYNPLETPVTHYVRLPVHEKSYTVTGPDGEEIVDVFNSIDAFSHVESVEGTPREKELVFAARNVPAFGVQLYHVQEHSDFNDQKPATDATKFGNKNTGFEIDPETGLLQTVTIDGVIRGVTQEFFYYQSATSGQMSGAYVFRPSSTEAVRAAKKVTVTATIGNLVDEVHQKVNDWITQIIRVYKDDDVNHIEFDWLVGPIPLNEDKGREVITRFTAHDFNNSGTFYTDSNGREMIKRTLNQRYDYHYTATNEPIASNYYPINSKLAIIDEQRGEEMLVLNDRAQGGTSLKNGQIELMVHRRTFADDNKGVNEALNEVEFDLPVVARGKHLLTFKSTKNEKEAIRARKIAIGNLLQPTVFVAATEASPETLKLNSKLKFEGINEKLPENVHVLTLEPLQGNYHIVRLENIMEKSEDSTPATFYLSTLFATFDVTEIRETTLGANQWLDEFDAKRKYAWNIADGGYVVNKPAKNGVKSPTDEIVLEPMQIRTFIVKVTSK